MLVIIEAPTVSFRDAAVLVWWPIASWHLKYWTLSLKSMCETGAAYSPRSPSIKAIPTLVPAVYKQGLLWASCLTSQSEVLYKKRGLVTHRQEGPSCVTGVRKVPRKDPLLSQPQV